MLYAILIHGSEPDVAAMPADAYDALMARHTQLRADLTAEGRLGPTLRLERDGGHVVRRYKDRRYVTDGPFAETKEQLMGIYVIEAETLEAALDAVDRLDFDGGVFEVRPLVSFEAGTVAPRPHGT
jgi:hypothetical protein